MNIHQKFVSVGYKFSTLHKNDPVTILVDAKALAQMFECVIPLAIVAKKGKGHHTKLFKVHTFKVMPKLENNNIEGKPVCVKGKQGSKYHTIIIYILIKTQTTRPIYGVMEAGHNVVDMGTHSQNILKLKQK